MMEENKATACRVWVGMDYLTVSMPGAENPGKWVVVLGELFQSKGERENWQHGYKGLDICGGYGQILSRPCVDASFADLLVRLPGRALEWIRESNVLADGDLKCTDADICRFFLDHGWKATRIDIAIDTNDPAITAVAVEAHLKSRVFTGRVKTAGLNTTWAVDDPENTLNGATVYIGGRTSSRFMRCYNKRAEVLSRTGKDIGHLTRFELENKAEAADLVMGLMAEKGAACIAGIFRGWINFKDASDEEPRLDRKRNIGWWERLVGESAAIVLGLKRGVATPEKSVFWLEKQVAKTLLLAKEHGFFPHIAAVVEEKRGKIKPTEWQKWADYEAYLKKKKERNQEGGRDEQ